MCSLELQGVTSPASAHLRCGGFRVAGLGFSLYVLGCTSYGLVRTSVRVGEAVDPLARQVVVAAV
jgi:hypothetical protein